MLPLLGKRPYRCERCRHRFYGPLEADRAPVEPEVSLPVEHLGKKARTHKRPSEERPRSWIWKRRCPSCGSGEVYRSHPRLEGDELRQLVLIFPYRCHDCNERLYGPLLVAWMKRPTPPAQE